MQLTDNSEAAMKLYFGNQKEKEKKMLEEGSALLKVRPNVKYYEDKTHRQ